MNHWLRLYSEIVNDPKVLVLTEALRWRYVALLCLQCNGTYQNRPDDEIALSLRVTLEDWEVTKNEFIKRGLIEKSGKIHGWDKRQFISDLKDPTASERQKRYRQKKRDTRNDTVTLRPPELDTELELDIVRESKDSLTKRARVTVDELSLNHISDWLAKKRSEGKYIQHDENFILEYFKNYCNSKGKKYADYPAALRNAFEWDACKPTQGRAHAQSGNGHSAGNKPDKSEWTSAAERIIAEDRERNRIPAGA